jgi:hypothetical protein
MAWQGSKRLAAILGKKRWTKGDAALVLEEARRSSLTRTDFAMRGGFDAQRLYRWERVFESMPGAAPAVSFEEVPLPPSNGSVGERFELVLRSGHVVRIPVSFDDATLRRLVAILDQSGGEC